MRDVEYKICKRCIMDTTSDPNLILDEEGVCNYCRAYDIEEAKIQHMRSPKQVESLFETIKRESKNCDFDCILGISGGVDSSYLAYLACEYDLRILAVHVDCGWNSELAVHNIESICNNLKLDLHTVVVDWETMKELQRAYLFSGLANQDVPQDHCFLPATRQIASRYKVRYILNGYNLSTEGILSTAYQQSAADWGMIKDVYRKHGRGGNLSKYPHNTLFDKYVTNPLLHGQIKVAPLNLIDYHKKDAIALLEREFDWKYYGGKHYESRFTKFFQETYLPERYGWEKRRDHLSSLIVGGELSREEALREMKAEPTTEHSRDEERDYVLKKLDISREEWDNILKLPHRTLLDFRGDYRFEEKLKEIKRKYFSSIVVKE